VLLKKSRLAHALGDTRLAVTLATAPPRKFQPGVRDIHFVGKHRNAHRFNSVTCSFTKVQQYIQIVDHQVVNYIDIQAARCEDTQAVDLGKRADDSV